MLKKTVVYSLSVQNHVFYFPVISLWETFPHITYLSIMTSNHGARLCPSPPFWKTGFEGHEKITPGRKKQDVGPRQRGFPLQNV